MVLSVLNTFPKPTPSGISLFLFEISKLQMPLDRSTRRRCSEPRLAEMSQLVRVASGAGTSGYPGFRFPHLKIYRISHCARNDFALPQRSFFLACLVDRYLQSHNYI